MHILNAISEPRHTVGQFGLQLFLLFSQLLHRGTCRERIAPGVLATAPCRHKEREDKCHPVRLSASAYQPPQSWLDIPHKSDQYAVALDEAWAVARQVDIGGNDSTAVAAHYLHGDSGPALQAAADVGAVPCEAEGYLRVDAC